MKTYKKALVGILTASLVTACAVPAFASPQTSSQAGTVACAAGSVSPNQLGPWGGGPYIYKGGIYKYKIGTHVRADMQ